MRARFQTGRGRPVRGMVLVLVAVIAFIVLLPLSVLVFEIGRLHVANEQLKAACDAAALGAAISVSNPNSTSTDTNKSMSEAGLRYFRRNMVCGQSLADAQLQSGKNKPTSAGDCQIALAFDQQSRVVTVAADLALDPAFRFLGINTFVISSSSKANVGKSRQDIVVVLDTSGSMWSNQVTREPMRSAVRVTQSFITDARDEEENHFGLITYATYVSGDPRAKGKYDPGNSQPPVPNYSLPRVELNRTDDNAVPVVNSLTGLGAMGGTMTGDALNAAVTMVTGPGHRDDAEKVIILVTDGIPGDGTRAIDVARAAGTKGITIHTIGFFHNNADSAQQFVADLTHAAGGASASYIASDINQLSEALGEIRTRDLGLVE